MQEEPVAIAKAAEKPPPLMTTVAPYNDESEAKAVQGGMLDDPKEEAKSSSGSSSHETGGSDFKSMIRLMGMIVQFILELLLDIVLSVFMLLPLVLPWRTVKIFKTNVFVYGALVDRVARIAARKAAGVHIAGALLDLIVVPTTIVTVFFPMRTWAVIDALINQKDYRTDIRGWFILKQVDYDLSLRFALLTNFLNIFLDVPLLVCGLIAVLTPWRTYEVIKGSCYIGRHVPESSDYRHRMDLKWPEIALRKDTPAKLRAKWRNMKSLASLRKRQKALKAEEDAMEKPKGFIAHHASQPWSGRQSGMLHNLRVWWLSSCIGAVKDLAAVIATLIAMLIPTRWEPFIREVCFVFSLTERPQYEFEAEGKQSFSIAHWRRLQSLCYNNFVYAWFDLLAILCFLFTCVTLIRSVPLISNLKLDWRNSPRYIQLVLPGLVDLGPEFSTWDINGRYVRRGWFKDYPCFRRRSGDSDKHARGLLGYWDGWWHICPLEITESALVRFGAKIEDTVASHSPITQSSSEWEARKGPDAPWEKVEECQLTVTSTDSVHTWWFGRNGYNMRIRCHCYKQALYFLMDILLLPFMIFTVSTGYRAPALWIKMKQDGLPDDDELDGDDPQEGYRLVFDWNCRKECLRQPLFFVLDVLILPLFLCVCLTFWRLPEVIAAFDYFDIGFHKEVLSKTHVLCLDIFMLIPLLFLVLTRYRIQYVYETKAKHTDGSIDWQSRIEVFRQFGLLLVDLLSLVPILFVFGTYYRRSCLRPFDPRGLRWHLSVWLSFIVVIHDIVIITPCTLLQIALLRRAKPMCVNTYAVIKAVRKGDVNEVNEKVEECRQETYIHLWLLGMDIVTLPASLLVLLTWYRLKYIGSLLRLDGEFHEDLLNEALVVLMDIFMYGPMIFFLLLTVYRARPMLREMRRDNCGCICCNVRDAARDAALRRRRRNQRRQRRRNLTGRGEAAADEDEEARPQQEDLAPRVWHEMNRNITIQAINDDREGEDHWNDMVDWNQAPIFDPAPQVRRIIRESALGLVFDLPFIFVSIPLLLLVWRLPLVCSEWQRHPRARDRRRLIAWHSALSVRDLLIFPFFLVLLVTERAPPLMRQLCARREARLLQTPPKLNIHQIELVFPEEQQNRCFIRIQGTFDEWIPGLVDNSLRLHVCGPGFWSELRNRIGKGKTWFLRSILPYRLRSRNSDVYDAVRNTLDFARAPGMQEVPGRTSLASANRSSEMSSGGNMRVSIQSDDFEREEVDRIDPPENIDRNVEFIVWVPGKQSATTQQLALTVLDDMDGEEFVLLQIEGKERTTQQKIVLCRAAMRIQQVREVVRSKGGSIQRNQFADDETVQWAQGARVPGLIETWGGVVVWELGQFGLDQVHFVMFIFLMLAPWRWIQLVKHLCEPSDYWPCHVSNEMCEIHEEACRDQRRVRFEMRTVCNTIARNLQETENWCGPEGMISVPEEINAYSSYATVQYNKLLNMMRARLFGVPGSVAYATKTWLEIQDAQFHYMILECYLQCLVSAERISLEEHDIMMDIVKKADRSFAVVEERAYHRVREVHQEEWRIAKAKSWERIRGGGCNVCQGKDSTFIRQIVRTMAHSAMHDYLALIAFLMIFLTLYRIPLVVRTLMREEGMKPTSMKFKNFCWLQIKSIGSDFGMAIQIFFLTLGILLTLVRIPEAFEDIVTKSHTMESVRFVLIWNFMDAVQSIVSNMLLLGLLRTWKLLAGAAIQSALLPPVCLGELLNRTCQFVRVEIRCVISFILFYGILMVPPITRWVDPPSPAASVWSGVLAAVLFLCACSVATAMRKKPFRIIPQQEWKSATMRLTWCNLIACISTVSQPALLCMLLMGLYSESWPLTISCSASEALMPVGVTLTCIWLVLISMLLMVSLTEAVPLWVLQIMLSQLMFMPIIFMLLGPTYGKCSRSSDAGVTEAECVAFAFFLAYVVTTQLFSMDSPIVKALPRACGMGVRYASLYFMGAQLLDLLIAALPIMFEGKTLPLVFVLLVSICNAIWTVSYKRCFNANPCCVPHVSVVKVSSSIGVAWTALVLICDFLPGVVWWIGTFLLLIGTSVAVWQARKKAAVDRNNMLKLSGISNLISEILRQEEYMYKKQVLLLGWVESGTREHWRQQIQKAESARVVAHYILDFEECIQAEQFNIQYLDRRGIWRDEMFAVRTIPTLMERMSDLQAGIRSPSTVPGLLKVSSEILGRVDIAPKVLDFLVGHEHLTVLMQAAVLALPSWTVKSNTGIGATEYVAHCRHVWAIMEDVLLHFSKESLEVTPYDRKFLMLSPWSNGEKVYSEKIFEKLNSRTEAVRYHGLLRSYDAIGGGSQIEHNSEWDERSGARLYGPDGTVYCSEPLHITRAGREGGLLDPRVDRASIQVPTVQQFVTVVEEQETRPVEERRTEHELTQTGRQVDRRSTFLQDPTGQSERDRTARTSRLSLLSVNSPDPEDGAADVVDPTAAPNAGLSQVERMRAAAQRGRRELEFDDTAFDIGEEALPANSRALMTQDARPKNAPSSSRPNTLVAASGTPIDELKLQEVVTNGNGTSASSTEADKVHVKEAWPGPEDIVGKEVETKNGVFVEI